MTTNVAPNDTYAESSPSRASPPDGVYYIPAPPESVYPTFQTGLDALYAFVKEQGYDVSRNKSRKNKQQTIYKYIICCTRSGKLDNTRKLRDEDRVRTKRTSKKIGCEMGIIFVADDVEDPAGAWRVKHQQGNRSFWHSHPPVSASELPGHRRRERTQTIRNIILSQRDSGINVAQTLAAIRQENSESLITREDILNERRRAHQWAKEIEALEGRQSQSTHASMDLQHRSVSQPPLVTHVG